MMNEPRVNFWPADSNELFRDVDLRIFEAIAERGQRRIGVVVDREDRARPADASRRLEVALHHLDRRVEHLHISDAHDLDVEQLAERPAGVVVRIALRIVRRPVLIVEQRVGDAAVRLVHADEIRAGGEGPRLGLRLLGVGTLTVLRWMLLAIRRRRVRAALAVARRVVRHLTVGALLSRNRDCERRGRARDFTALQLQHAQ